ncbi:PAS-domain containing protein [Acidovorax sp. sif1233]|uniref:sensor domain-containing diguanylate cyclase n=1 Tax=Acidovorax sp. sif1233 TaxID=2854792 RepID=UPI001C47FCFC|nr:GGDEF domain-containing protein [Acidovorax sp. sif1233]MBV7455518.1 PAS-domain containing protein [Acidovorax sp. sif1233]
MSPPPPREDPLALPVAGLCGVGGLALLGWALAGQDAGNGTARAMLAAAGVALAALALLHGRLALRARRLRRDAAALRQAAGRASMQLSATLDILPDGLAIYDAEDRLVLCNAQYRQVAADSVMPLEYGTRFEDVLRRAAQSGRITAALPDTEAWLRERMARHRSPAGPEVQEMQGDRWLRITERGLDGGGVVVLRTDITEAVHSERALKRALHDAERAERSLREAVDAMPAGLEIYDETDRLVLCNSHMERLRPHLRSETSLGKTYEELLREGLRQGIPEAAQGQEELWLAHEMALRGHRPGPEVRHEGGGAWIHMHESRTPSGMTVCVRLDITDLIEQRQVAEAARQESQHTRQLLERAVEALPVSIEIFDEQDRLVLYNQQLSRMYPHMNYAEHLGRSFADILRHSVDRGLIPSAHGREEAWIAERLSEHGSRTSTLVQRLADGRWINIYETRTPENYVVAVRLDITDLIEQRQALEAAQEAAHKARELLQDAVESLPEGFALFDADDRLVVCNAQYRKLYPISAPMIVPGSTFEQIARYGVERGQYLDAVGNEEDWIAQRVADHRSASQAVLQRLPHGRWLQADERRTPQGGIAGVRTDVTLLVRKEQELAAANEKLALLSTTDGVTGIGNRRRFDERLATEWLRCGRHQAPLAVVLIDIDHFKLYNDHYGHIAGDACLRHVAQLLQATIRRADEVAARYGGEEFVLLLPDTLLPDAVTVAQRCMDGLREAALPHPRSPTAPMLTLSIGVASLVPRPDTGSDTLVQAADAALYRAKHGGRNRFEVFSPPPSTLTAA